MASLPIPLYPGRCPGLSAHWPFRPFLRRVFNFFRYLNYDNYGPIIHIMAISFQRNKTQRCLTQIPQIPQMAAHPCPLYYAQPKICEIRVICENKNPSVWPALSHRHYAISHRFHRFHRFWLRIPVRKKPIWIIWIISSTNLNNYYNYGPNYSYYGN